MSLAGRRRRDIGSSVFRYFMLSHIGHIIQPTFGTPYVYGPFPYVSYYAFSKVAMSVFPASSANSRAVNSSGSYQALSVGSS
jgi:hypothetical protein